MYSQLHAGGRRRRPSRHCHHTTKAKHPLHELAEVLAGDLLLLAVLLLALGLLDIEALLSDGLELLAVVLLVNNELLDSIQCNGVCKIPVSPG